MLPKLVDIAVSLDCDVPEEVILFVDFESTSATGFKTVFPESRICRCFFHLWQTVIRKLKNYGLFADYKADERLRTQVRLVLAIAFLPPDEVASCFYEISSSFDQVMLSVGVFVDQ